MTTEEMKTFLYSLLFNWEDEVVEFKRGGKGFSTGEIGEYFSALANEANLRCLPRAWLVFGVDNKTHKVIGTGEQYRRIFIDFLRRFPGITRRKINEFMMEEIRGDLTEKQKRAKISNLMTGLRRNGKIVNKGSDKEPRWFYID